LQSISIIEQRVTAGNQFDGVSGAATGSITTVAGSALVIGEAFFLKDGKGAEVEFRFVSTTAGFPFSETLRPVVFTGSDTADDVRDTIIAAINATRGLNVLANNSGAATVGLTNREGGTHGNVTPTADTVVDGTFAVSAMTGGTNRPFIDVDGSRFFDPQPGGGQFDFPFSFPQSIPHGQPARGGVLTWVVERVRLVGNATGHTINAVTPEGVVVLESGAGGNLIAGPFTLAGDERLRLTTSGATGDLIAQVFARPGIPLPVTAL
jgi:hypothetical protein